MLATRKGGKSLQASEDEIYAASCFSSLATLYPNITHELRGKLSNIVLHLELLREMQDVALPHQEGAQPLAEIALAEVYAFNRALQCLLDLMQPPQEAHRSFDVVPVLHGLTVLCEAQAKRQRITATVTLPPEPQPINGDMNEIRQAVMGLILFVMAGIPAGGALTIRAIREADQICLALEEGPRGADKPSGGFIEPPASGAEQQHLALFVAQSVISRHGGTLQVSTPATGVPAVHVSLPLHR